MLPTLRCGDALHLGASAFEQAMYAGVTCGHCAIASRQGYTTHHLSLDLQVMKPLLAPLSDRRAHRQYIPASVSNIDTTTASHSCCCCCCGLQVIPGNETKVAEMLNSLAMQGARVVAGRADNLHVSGHAYQVGGLVTVYAPHRSCSTTSRQRCSSQLFADFADVIAPYPPPHSPTHAPPLTPPPP